MIYDIYAGYKKNSFFSYGIVEVGTRRSASAKELRLEALSLAIREPETPKSSKASSATVQDVIRRRGGSDIPQLNYSDFDETTEQQSNVDKIVREQRDSNPPPATSRKSKKVLIIIFWLNDQTSKKEERV